MRVASSSAFAWPTRLRRAEARTVERQTPWSWCPAFDLLSGAEDAGFEPARVLTQHDFQFWSYRFAAPAAAGIQLAGGTLD